MTLLPLLPVQSFRKLQAVRPGDTVAVVAPAGPFDKVALDAGVAVISGVTGFVMTWASTPEHATWREDDGRRFTEFTAALTNPTSKPCSARAGGYGAMRLLPRLASWAAETVFHRSLWSVSRISPHSTSGFKATESRVFTRRCSPNSGAFRRRAHDACFPFSSRRLRRSRSWGKETYVGGTVEGPLLGGNLSVFTRLLGTPFMPPLEGAILLLE